MNPKEIVPEGAEWIHWALDRRKWRALVSDNVNEVSGSTKCGELFG
jgi:hypothetical protein